MFRPPFLTNRKEKCNFADNLRSWHKKRAFRKKYAALYNKLVFGSLLIIERENVKARLPMNDSTPFFDKKTSRIFELKNKLVRPSKDTLFFLQLFARVYEPQVVMGVA